MQNKELKKKKKKKGMKKIRYYKIYGNCSNEPLDG